MRDACFVECLVIVFQVLLDLLFFFSQNRMASLNFGGENEIIQLQERAQQLTQESRNLKDTIYNFTARRPYTNFTYTDPTPNFDRRQVHGPICKLIKVKSPETAFALEIAAGGRVTFDNVYKKKQEGLK